MFEIKGAKYNSHLPIRPIFMPARASARRADCAPGPGVLVLKIHMNTVDDREVTT